MRRIARNIGRPRLSLPTAGVRFGAIEREQHARIGQQSSASEPSRAVAHSTSFAHPVWALSASATLRQSASTTGRRYSWSNAWSDSAGLGGAIRRLALAEAMQPAHRSVRAGRRYVQHLLRLVAATRLPGAGR